jgi:shikimate dehydrogenase
MHYGLLGKNLSHSYSPQIHNAFADYDYALMEIEPECLETFMQTANFRGINVTIPYKKAVLPYCSSLSEQAQRLNAVNTIVRKDDGTLLGHNTDYFGFQELLRTSGLNVQDKKVLVLGSGGAGVTASAVLADMGAKVVIQKRRGPQSLEATHA